MADEHPVGERGTLSGQQMLWVVRLGRSTARVPLHVYLGVERTRLPARVTAGEAGDLDHA
jgi:hypothetical protein